MYNTLRPAWLSSRASVISYLKHMDQDTVLVLWVMLWIQGQSKMKHDLSVAQWYSKSLDVDGHRSKSHHRYTLW